MTRLRLGLNVDHVATLRNARGGAAPDPVRAAQAALEAGADSITAHLREDRRHIRDADIEALSALTRRLGRPLNLEMAVTTEMQAIALRLRPEAVCLVPERRQELTTEGGLDVIAGQSEIASAARALHQAGARVSLFVEANPAQIAAAHAAGAQAVELHTGAYCDAARDGRGEDAARRLQALVEAAHQAAGLGLEVHAGHGLDFETVGAVAAIPELVELNIGHFLVGEALFSGLASVIGRMRALMDQARAAPR